MFLIVFVTIKLPLFLGTIIKQFKCVLENKSCFLLRMAVFYEQIQEQSFFPVEVVLTFN